ncbi:MAG: hypothetical protein HeimC3_34470 [Candidatus Heimdallarchaeota archaeon LC_3]|nr:MAG: hypothetical protein HeimC3_34470 [Candidatus Heimdallarchaeota archaeon LC_3]
MFQLCLSIILIIGFFASSQYIIAASNNSFFNGGLETRVNSFYGGEFGYIPFIEIEWNYSDQNQSPILNRTIAIEYLENLSQNKNIKSYNLEITVPIKIDNKLVNLIFDSNSLGSEIIIYPLNHSSVYVSSNTYESLQNNNISELNSDIINLVTNNLSLKEYGLLDSRFSNETMIIPFQSLNLTKLFDYSYSATLELWIASETYYTEFTEHEKQINLTVNQLKSEFKNFIALIESNDTTFKFQSNEDLYYNNIINLFNYNFLVYTLLVIIIFYLISIICFIILMFDLIKANKRIIRIFLIRGYKINDYRFLANYYFTLGFFGLLIIINLILLLIQTGYFPLSKYISQFIIVEMFIFILFQLMLKISFILMDNFSLSVDDEPLLLDSSNALIIRPTKDIIKNPDFSFSSIDKLLGVIIILLGIYMIAKIIISSKFLFNLSDIDTFIGLLLLIIVIILIQRFEFYLAFFNKKIHYLRGLIILPKFMKMSKNHFILYLLVFLIFIASFQILLMTHGFKYEELQRNYNYAGDIEIGDSYKNISMNSINTFITKQKYITSFYQSYHYPVTLKAQFLTPGGLNISLTMIDNVSSFLNIRTFPEENSFTKEMWINFFNGHQKGVIINNEVASRNGIRIGDQITIENPFLNLNFSVRVMFFFHGAINPFQNPYIMPSNILSNNGNFYDRFENIYRNIGLSVDLPTDFPSDQYPDLNSTSFYNQNVYLKVDNSYFLPHYVSTLQSQFPSLSINFKKDLQGLSYDFYQSLILRESWINWIGIVISIFLFFLVYILHSFNTLDFLSPSFHLLHIRGLKQKEMLFSWIACNTVRDAFLCILMPLVSLSFVYYHVGNLPSSLLYFEERERIYNIQWGYYANINVLEIGTFFMYSFLCLLLILIIQTILTYYKTKNLFDYHK